MMIPVGTVESWALAWMLAGWVFALCFDAIAAGTLGVLGYMRRLWG